MVKIRNAQIIWAFLFFATLFFSCFQLHANFWVGSIAIISVILCYWTYSSGNTINKYRAAFFVFISLFLYSVILSKFTARSTSLALNFLASFYFFCTLLDLKLKPKSNISLKIISSSNIVETTYLEITKVISGAFIFAHAIYLIYQYSITPIRVTGFFLDYSQASLCILISFGFLYRILKENKFGSVITFILFLGFFTTYSRSANFLLVVFLISLAWYEFKHSNLKYITKSTLIICLTFILVQLYPTLIGHELIDRGGFANLTTLNSRTYYWELAFSAIKQSPFIGTGLGNFEFLGIKERFPFLLVNSTHNDFLQIWVDLGVFWLILFMVTIVLIIVRNSPINLDLSFKTPSSNKTIAWVLLVCTSLYMTINFVIYTFIFQLFIAILLAELLTDEKN